MISPYLCQCSDIAVVLYGSELEQRAEYEKVHIPGIVTRCIEEVELRGMHHSPY